MSVLEEFNGNITEYEYQKRQERKQERKRKRDAKIIQALEDVKAEVEAKKRVELSTNEQYFNFALTEVTEIINRKIAEVSGKDCRDCKKWNDCECGKKGHDNGTSIGYSAGECAEYDVKGDKT